MILTKLYSFWAGGEIIRVIRCRRGLTGLNYLEDWPEAPIRSSKGRPEGKDEKEQQELKDLPAL